jgi:hypothetical protein
LDAPVAVYSAKPNVAVSRMTDMATRMVDSVFFMIRFLLFCRDRLDCCPAFALYNEINVPNGTANVIIFIMYEYHSLNILVALQKLDTNKSINTV